MSTHLPKLVGTFADLAVQFRGTVSDLPGRYVFVQQLSASLEMIHANYEPFMEHMLPALLESLLPPIDATPEQLAALPPSMGQAAFYENHDIHKIRTTILDLLNRLTNSNLGKKNASKLLQVAMGVLKMDNEENAIICLRIIFEIHKIFQNTLEADVPPFLHLFIALYAHVDHSLEVSFNESFQPNYEISPATVHTPLTLPPAAQETLTKLIGPPPPTYPSMPPLPPPTQPTDPQPSGTPPWTRGKLMIRGVDSFKVLTEIPMIIMLIFQTYANFQKDVVPILIPYMVDCIKTKLPSPPPHIASILNGPPSLSPYPSEVLRWKQFVNDFLSAQSKTLSFLIYVLKPWTVLMKEHMNGLVVRILDFLDTCPSDHKACRKELLVTIRHILATEFRTAFFPHINRLLDNNEELLVGKNRSATQDDLRHLASSTLNDIIQHARSELTLPQLTRVIYVFSRNLHDSTLSMSIQISSARHMMNLVDYIYRTQESQDGRTGRNLLIRILWAVANKFETLKDIIPKRIEAYVHKLRHDQLKLAELRATTAQAAAAAAAAAGSKEEAALAAAAVTAQNVAAAAAKEVAALPPLGPTQSMTSTHLLTNSNLMSSSEETPEDAIRDIKQLVYVMTFGLKAVVWCTTNFRLMDPQTKQKTTVPFHEEEVNVLCRLFENGLRTLKVFSPTVPAPVSASSAANGGGSRNQPQMVTLQIPGNNPTEESETLDNFASLFMALDPMTFKRILTAKMESLFQQIVNDSPKFSLIVIPQAFLKYAPPNTSSSSSGGAASGAAGASGPGGPSGSSSTVTPAGPGGKSGPKDDPPTVSRVFCEILIHYLVKHMAQMSLSPAESNVSSVLLQLFRSVFTTAVDNESILRPFMQPIVQNCLRLATRAKHPYNYLSLLRHLFRAIGGGRFEHLYKEFLNLLPELLNSLMNLHSKGTGVVRDISIELCLTVPARLSALLNYIPIIMKAVLLALQGTDEQVIKLSLRTLDFWVDNLNPDYLYPHMCPVLNDLLRALTNLIRPAPSPFGNNALIVLGKLGGRNRRFFIDQFTLNAKKSGIEDGWNIGATFEATIDQHGELERPSVDESSSLQFSMNVDRTVEMARSLLLKDYPGPFSLQAPQNQQFPVQPIHYILTPTEDGSPNFLSTSSASYVMQHKVVQKYHAFLYLRSVLLSMLDMKGDFQQFKARLPTIESAQARADRLKREKAEAEERESQPSSVEDIVNSGERMQDVTAYSGPNQSLVSPVVTITGPATSASGQTTNLTTPQQIYARPMGPQPAGDMEGEAIASRFQNDSTRSLFKSLVQAMIIAASDIYLKKVDVSQTAGASQSKESDVEPFLEGLISHFAMVSVHLPPNVNQLMQQQADEIESITSAATSNVNGSSPTPMSESGEAPDAAETRAAIEKLFAEAPAFETYHLDLALFLDAIFGTMCEENRYWSSAAVIALRHFIATFITLVGPEAAAKAPIVSEMLIRFTHACHGNKWELRHGGVVGLSLLIDALPISWQFTHSGELIRALIFVFRDEDTVQADLTKARSRGTLTTLVKECCRLAMEQWQIRKNMKAAEFEHTVEVTLDEENAGTDGEPGLTTTTPATGSQSTADAMDTTSTTSKESSQADGIVATPVDAPIPMVRTESTATDTTSVAAASDIADIHMADVDETKSNATEKKEQDGDAMDTAAPAAPAAPVVDPLAPVAKGQFDESKSHIIHVLINHILPELYASTEATRKEAHALIEVIGETIGRPVPAIMLPYRHKLIQPIRSKQPLNSVPLATRIGYISAATFAISLPKPLMQIRELKSLIQDVLNDQAEDMNYGGHHPVTRMVKQDLMTKLRIESIHLMSAAICSEEVQRNSKELKDYVVRLFFRSLMSRNPEVAKVAQQGLKAVIDREKLPKDLLQACLRPVLLNVADLTKLSLGLLSGLARLVELLSGCFNGTLGEKLLEHLRVFADVNELMKMRATADNTEKELMKVPGQQGQQALQMFQSTRIRPEDEPKYALGIMDLFYLLPPAYIEHPSTGQPTTNPPTSKFLEPLVRYTLALEEMLPISPLTASAQVPAGYPLQLKADEEMTKKPDVPAGPPPPTYSHSSDVGSPSPYRLALIKFLNVNSYRACEYFLKSCLTSSKSRLMFISILRDPTAGPLRACMVKHPELLVTWTFKWIESPTAAQVANRYQHAVQQHQQQQQAAAAAAAASTAASTTGTSSSASSGAVTSTSVGSTTSTSVGSTTSTAMDTSTSVPASTEAVAGSTTNAAATSDSSGSSSSQLAGSTTSTSTDSTTASVPPVTAVNPMNSPPVVDEWNDRIVHGIHLSLIISSFHPEFLSAKNVLSKNLTVLQYLLEIWDSKSHQTRIAGEQNYPSNRLSYLDESRMLVECALNHLRVHHDAIDLVWKTLTVFQLRSLTDYTFVIDFYRAEIAQNWTPSEKRHLLHEYMKYFEDLSHSEFLKSRALRYLILPMLKVNLQQRVARQPIVDADMPYPSDESGSGSGQVVPPTPSNKMQLDDHSGSPTLQALPPTTQPPPPQPLADPATPKNAFDPQYDALDSDITDFILLRMCGKAPHGLPVFTEDLRVETIRLAMMLMKYVPREILNFRTSLISFFWQFLKSEATPKYWAYYAIARFIEKWETKESHKPVMLQVYVALLKSHQSEGRLLVKKALDTLIPAFPMRFLKLEQNQPKPTWVKWTQKVLVSESHNVAQLMHILNIIVRHADIFYPSRGLFMHPIMEALIKRLGLSTHRTIEQRTFVINLLEVVINWYKRSDKELKEAEKAKSQGANSGATGDATMMDVDSTVEQKGQETPPTKKPKIDVQTDANATNIMGTPVTPAAAAAAAASSSQQQLGLEYRMPPHWIEVVSTFLTRFALMNCEIPDYKSLSRRAVRLLRDGMELWQGQQPQQDQKFQYIEKILSQPVDTAMVALYQTTLEVIGILFKYSSPAYMLSSIHSLDKIIGQCLKAHTVPVVRDGVCEVLPYVMTAFPIEAPRQPSDELTKFYRNIKESIVGALKGVDKYNQISTQMAVLNVMLKHCPAFMDSNFPLIIKAVQKLAKDHVSKASMLKNLPTTADGTRVLADGSKISQGQLQEERHKFSLITDSLRKGCQIIADRIGVCGEHKKIYLSTLAHLIDKSVDIPLLFDVTRIVTPWITSQEVAAPTTTTLPPPAVPLTDATQSSVPMDVSTTSTNNNLNAPPPLDGSTPTPASTSPPLSSLPALVNPPPGSILNSKEKANFVLKMCRYDRFDSPELLHKLLDIVLTCFSSEALKPMEWLSKLQRAFMLGLRCRDRVYREKFVSLFHSHISPAVFDRLNYIFSLQDWENLSDSFWITQTTDLLLSIIQTSQEIAPASTTEGLTIKDEYKAKVLAQPKRAHQLTFPSFDPSYWKSNETIERLLAEEKIRLHALAKQRSIHNDAVKVEGDSKVPNGVKLEKQSSVNPKKRSHEAAFDEKKSKEVAASSTYTSPSFSSSPDIFAILASGAEDSKVIQNVLQTNDPRSLRDAFLAHQATWFYQHTVNPISHMIHPMRELIHSNYEFTGRCWTLLLPHAWSKITQEQRQELVHPITTLLGRDWHNRLQCDRDHLHPVQALLQAFVHCHPTPAVAPELLRYLAKAYNSWTECVQMLEQRILYGPEAPISANIPSYDALAYLYRELGEEDLWHGLWRRRIVSDYSHAALALEQYSMFPRAQDYFYSAMNKKHSGGEHAANEVGPVGRSETIMWEEEWLRCSKQVNQWEVLKDFAQQTGHMELSWEAAWRLGDWTTLREMCAKHNSAEIPNAKIYQVSVAIHDRFLLNPAQESYSERDMDKMVESTIHHALRDWQSYPAFVWNAHIPLFQRFQRIVELSESSQMLAEIVVHQRPNPPNTGGPNFKNFITTWKERLLNKWDELPAWSEVFVWRCHLWNMILKLCANGQDTDPTYARIHDLPWTVIKLAQVARKTQQPGVCLQILTKIQQFSRFETTDMFTRLREQIKTCLQSPVELHAALNILSSTNLEFFSTDQKAELFRLKGEALQHLGFGDESNTAFSACLSISDTYGRGWLSWASFCDRVYTLKKDIMWADHALICYVQAIGNKFKKATLHMSRIFYLLSCDDFGGPVIKSFSRFWEFIPLWVYLMWLPQLLGSLARPECYTAHRILRRIAVVYPQSLYYTMRAHLIEQRDTRSASLQQYFAQQQQSAQATAAPVASSSSSPSVPPPTGTSSGSSVANATGAAASEKKEDTAMTDVASTTATAGSEEKPAPPTPVDVALSNTSQSGFQQTGAPGAIAKSTANAPVATQPLKPEVAAEKPQEAAEALAAAQTQANAAHASAHPTGTSSTPSTTTGAPSTGPTPPGTAGPGAAPGAPSSSTAPPPPEPRKDREMDQSQPPPNPNQSIIWVEDVCKAVRDTHPTLMGEIEKMLDELGRRFKPEAEEELFNAVHALLLKCFKHPPQPMDLIPGPLQVTIDHVARKYFRTNLVATNGPQRRHVAFIQKYKQAFEHDFCATLSEPTTTPTSGSNVPVNVPNPNFPKTFPEMIQRLKRWKTHLFYVLGCNASSTLRLEKLSPYLARFHSWDIEVPGQFIHDREPDHSQHVLVQRFDPLVTVHHVHGFSNRRLAMVGDDGKLYHFLAQYQIGHVTNADARMMQLYVLVNRLMRDFKECRKRHLVYYLPIVIPVTHRLRLAATDPGQVTLEDVYDQSCQVRGVDRDQPAQVYREGMKKLALIQQQHTADVTKQAAEINAHKLKIYNDITNHYVPDNILARYIQRTIPASDQYWVFKQHFCTQLGLSGFLSYLMKIGERHLHRIAFMKHNGKMINSEFYPNYNEQGLVESNEPVPFRLTRNIQTALSPTLIDGLFASVIMAAHSCLWTNSEVLKNYMSLFIRDDLVSWNSQKFPIDTDLKQRELEKSQKEKVGANAHMVLKRIQMLMPMHPMQGTAAEKAAIAAAEAAGHPRPPQQSTIQPLNHKVHLLIKVATSKAKLSTMSAQWAPWF